MKQQSDLPKETTNIPVTSKSLCPKIAKKYGWVEAADPVYTGIKDLPWSCVFEGSVEFPKAWHEVADD